MHTWLTLLHMGLFHLANSVAPGCEHTFFGLLPWYHFLNVQNVSVAANGNTVTVPCQVEGLSSFQSHDLTGHPIGNAFLLIALAVLDDLVRIAAMVAVGFVIVGGFKYITSQGDPNNAKSAQQTILNALVGVVIAVLAVPVVGFLGDRLGNANGVYNLPQGNANQSGISSILTIVTGVAASAAFLMVVYSGFKYITAQGDPSATAQARNSLIYSIIGLVVTLGAFGIVGFVLNNA